jgi:hypothetical protein
MTRKELMEISALARLPLQRVYSDLDRIFPWLAYKSPVIPAKAGIQGTEIPASALGPRFRGGDDDL